MANKKINQLVSKTAILSTDIFGIGDATTGQLFKKTIAELQAAIGGAVISVNGLVGTVVLDTDDIQELATPTNKYFTDARARGAISLTVTGNSGASTYSSGTGVLNVPTYTLAGLGGITATFLSGTSGISYNSTTGVISYSGTVYTDASIRALFSGGTGISYNSSTGAISYSGTVYTDSSVRALISITTTGDSGASTYNNTTGVINVPNYTLAGLGGISYTSLSGGTGITYNNTTGAISYSGTVYTDASVRALISASGAVSYNNTTGVISLTSGNLTEATSSVLTITGGTGAVLGSGTSIQVKQASSTVSGFLSSTDWNTFNGKASALSGTTNYVAKFTSSSAIGDSVIQEVSGNIGIGITPSASIGNLQIGGTANTSLFTQQGTDTVRIGVRASGRSGIVIDSSNATYTNRMWYIDNNGANGSLYIGRSGLDVLTLSNTGAATFSSTVSINTTNVVSTLEIGSSESDGTGSTNAIRIQSKTGASNQQLLIGINQTGTYSFLQSSQASVGYKSLSLNPNGGNVGVGITVPLTKLHVAGASPEVRIDALTGAESRLSFYDNGVEKYDIFLSGGKLQYYGGAYGNYFQTVFTSGNIALSSTTDNGYRFYVSGTIYATGNITANSDLTLKKNLELITNPTDKLMQLNGYSYQWKEDDSHQYGVIAQEVEKILPYAVSTGNDGIKGVSYNQIIPVLIEAVKEQKKELEELRNILASK
jgi:hypothetical protein